MSKLISLRSFITYRWLHSFPDRKRLEAYQNKALKRHVKFLRSHSAYFSNIPQITSISELERLPKMSKKVMMDNFDSMNTLGVRKADALEIAIKSEKTRDFAQTHRGVSVGLSSGTSGHRGLFIVSDHERYAWAGIVLAKFLPKGKMLGHRIAFFLRANNNLYETINSRFITFEYFDIYKDIEKHRIRLNKYQPSILVAPPSVLNILAGYVEKGTLKVEPKRVISVAEVLPSADEKRLKKIFRQDVIFQAYQCTEGFLASTCSYGSLHLNEDLVIIEKEWIDKKRFVPIITDFGRTSQPIIRYRLNDVLVASKKVCDCGSVFTVISKIEGREDDIFIFWDRNKKEVRVFSAMIGRCMLYASNFYEYRVVQVSYTTIEVYADQLTAVSKKSIEAEFKKLSKRLSFKPPKIVFKLYEQDISKKLKRIERKF